MSPALPRFTARDFTASTYDTSEQKAAFANRLVRLIAGDFRPAAFTKALYNALCLSFGFIAHYDRDGFYVTQLSALPRRINFLQTLYSPTLSAHYFSSRDPHISRVDVQRAFHSHPWLRSQLTRLQSLSAADIESTEGFFSVAAGLP